MMKKFFTDIIKMMKNKKKNEEICDPGANFVLPPLAGAEISGFATKVRLSILNVNWKMLSQKNEGIKC